MGSEKIGTDISSSSFCKGSVEESLCTCKRNVEGQLCDRCKRGFFNLTENNTEGCKHCSCNSAGIIDFSCKESGGCFCKKFVEGVKCEECLPGFYKLDSNNLFGCTGSYMIRLFCIFFYLIFLACECFPTGSIHTNCDDTGKCSCEPGFTGEKCDKYVEQMTIVCL